jgi:hypothetical protein
MRLPSRYLLPMHMAMFKWAFFTDNAYSSSAASNVSFICSMLSRLCFTVRKNVLAVCKVLRVRISDDSEYFVRGKRFDRRFCLTLQLPKRTDKRCLSLVALHLHLSRAEIAQCGGDLISSYCRSLTQRWLARYVLIGSRPYHVAEWLTIMQWLAVRVGPTQ